VESGTWAFRVVEARAKRRTVVERVVWMVSLFMPVGEWCFVVPMVKDTGEAPNVA
jgi:hypothetical protein